MENLVACIAKALVSKPDQVVVTTTSVKDDSMVIELKVAPEDMGKIIGRQGRIAKALRTVVKAASVRIHKTVVVEIVS